MDGTQRSTCHATATSTAHASHTNPHVNRLICIFFSTNYSIWQHFASQWNIMMILCKWATKLMFQCGMKWYIKESVKVPRLFIFSMYQKLLDCSVFLISEHFSISKHLNLLLQFPIYAFKVCSEGCYWEELCLLSRYDSTSSQLTRVWFEKRLWHWTAVALLLSSSTILHCSVV